MTFFFKLSIYDFFEIIYLIVTADKYIIMNYTLDDNILLTITTVVINSLCVGVDVYEP
jgi:hypothetical protein